MATTKKTTSPKTAEKKAPAKKATAKKETAAPAAKAPVREALTAEEKARVKKLKETLALLKADPEWPKFLQEQKQAHHALLSILEENDESRSYRRYDWRCRHGFPLETCHQYIRSIMNLPTIIRLANDLYGKKYSVRKKRVERDV